MRYLLALLLMVTGCQAASPSFSSFNTNQFSTNNLFISIKDGAVITNLNTRSFTSLPGETMTLNNVTITNWTDIATGGSSPFTNVAGIVQFTPGQAVTNELRVVSGSADAATNVAFRVDTAVPWSVSGSLLAAFQMESTNLFAFDVEGTLAIGRDVPNLLGYLPGFSAIFNTTLNESSNPALNLGAFDGSTYEYASIGVDVFDPTLNGIDISAGGVTRTQFRPGVASSGSAVAYLFDTSNVLTNGDSIISAQNQGSVRFRVDGNSGYAGAGTLFLSDDGTYKAGGTLINPTDGYLPYRSNATTFADSPWYRISTNELGFRTTGQFLWSQANGNIALGEFAMPKAALLSGTYNHGLGYSSLSVITNGSENVAVGPEALVNLVNGSRNIAVGSAALSGVFGATAQYSDNIGIGDSAGSALTSGTFNVLVGQVAGDALTSGKTNIFVGYSSGHGITTGNHNIAIGASALGNVGAGGVGNAENIVIGTGANQLATNDFSVVIGHLAGVTNAGSGLVSIGHSAFKNTYSGVRNVGLGYHSGITNTTGSDLVLIGYDANAKSATDTNSIAIGSLVVSRGSNTAQIGTNGVSVLYLNGTVGWFRGSGTPEAAVTAGVGSYFTREDGASGTTLYTKTSGTGNTGWEALSVGAGLTINPSNDYIPVRSGATTFDDSGLYRVGVTNIATDGQIIFGPGTTNVLYRGSGANDGSLVYTNGNAGGYGLHLQDPSNVSNQARFRVDSGGVARINSTASYITLDPFGSAAYVFDATEFHPGATGVNNGNSAVPWQDLLISRNISWNGTTNTLFDSWGIATPEASKTARIGSLFRETTSGALYKKADGTGNIGWETVHSGNMAYLAGDATATDTTFANLSISATVQNGKKYSFKLVIFLANSTPTDGAKFDFDGGSATATNFRVHGTAFGSALSGSAQSSALSTDHTVTTVTGDNMMEFNGSFEPSASGTFIPRFAESVDAGGTLTVYRGSNLILTEIP